MRLALPWGKKIMWWWAIGLVMAVGAVPSLRAAILNCQDHIDKEEDWRVQQRLREKNAVADWQIARRYPPRVWHVGDVAIVVVTTLMWPVIWFVFVAIKVWRFLKQTFMKLMFPRGLKSKYVRNKERLAAARELAARIQAEIDEHEMLAAEHDLPSIGYVLARAEAEAKFLEQATAVAEQTNCYSAPWAGVAIRD